ncbi:MAG TPA: SAM-dependent methyltransferase [Amycolatopsis sp.]|nr:SAM-dependent methyltransferase [Amycolatopsis sp.]
MDGRALSRDAERTVPTAAGVYDWLLGGQHYRPCDVDAANSALKLFPTLAHGARLNREFLQRAVCFLTAQGIEQFLDIGSGYPAAGNVHEIAQWAAPSSRVVYVDHDEHTVAVSRAILADNPGSTCVHGDVREPDAILDNSEVRSLLDLERPIGLLLLSVLPFVLEDAAPLVDRYLERLAGDSYLVLTHIIPPDDDRIRQSQEQTTRHYNSSVRQSARTRTREELRALFGGTELVSPGLVPVPDWRPLNAHKYVPDENDPARAVLVGAVGRTG